MFSNTKNNDEKNHSLSNIPEETDPDFSSKSPENSEEDFVKETDRRLAQSILNLNDDLCNIRKKIKPVSELAEHYLKSTETRPQLGDLLKTNALIQSSKLAQEKIPPFISIQERPVGSHQVSTRFISFINLKGGVGKTTLSANLAAAFASGNYKLPAGQSGCPLKVLVVDLDFQGTLSQRCLSKEAQSEVIRENASSVKLLQYPGRDPNQFLLPVYPFINRPQTAFVVPANEKLDEADFKEQTLLTLNRKETRYYYRLWFHNDPFFKNYDLVIFDCPPRLTTSSICSLVASDYAFTPCSPEHFDISAVNRTLNWIGTLQKNLDLRLRIAGVIFNRTNKSTGLSHKELSQKEILLNYLKEFYVKYPNCDTGRRPLILDHFIPRRSGDATSINGQIGESLPGETLDFFGNLASEIYQRIY